MSHLMMASQMSSTLPSQVGELAPGSWLASDLCTYQVQSFLGKGTFGKVVKCMRLSDMETVAIKMIKIQGSSVDQIENEVGNHKRTSHAYQYEFYHFVIMLCTVVPSTVFGEISTNSPNCPQCIKGV